MKLDRTGIILYTLRFEECVDFYTNVLDLEVMFTAEQLVCFKFGSSYLMVELDDEFVGVEEKDFRTRTCLRMNVEDVKAMADKLRKKNVAVNYQEHSWGRVAKFRDPDGNLCAFKDSATFEKQVSNGS